MTFYILHNLSLVLHQDDPDAAEVLEQLLYDLSWVRVDLLENAPELRLTVSPQANGIGIPPTAHAIFRTPEFCGFAHGDDFYLTDGASLLALQGRHGYGAAYLAPTFFHHPLTLQRNFWAFGLLKLLRPHGFYSLHAAGLVAPDGQGVLIVGPSGSGKSTLTVGLVRQGWRYLSDDTVLLQQQPSGIVAWALRKYCYIDASTGTAYADLPLGEDAPDGSGRSRRLLRLEDAYPDRAVAHCTPRVLLLARIVPETHSTIRPLQRAPALTHVLAESGPQLFDRSTMAHHLATLTQLMQQATLYELLAGYDLYQQPGRLATLLHQADGGRLWHAW
jgi:hypothetical protein